MLNKKAAMFGLDARIALAIFGSLSVISGAALYSAIANAKATAFLTDIQEMGKAWEAYLLDTGSDLPKATDASGKHRITKDLKASTVAGWNGPYLSYTVDGTYTEYLSHPTYGVITMISVSTLGWGLGHATATDWNVSSIRCNDTTIPCNLAIQVFDPSADNITIDLAKTIDEQVDGGDGATVGKVRWYEVGSARSLVYIYAPHKMPV
tara:strand:+ start:1800 stop:2423 length:624 start_codon:yes stop_codon:yes gene_type:complete